jgi:ATP/maltotriose-dependent transcriptional regulator MalT
MFSTLLATMLHRPRPTANLVARPRLTQRLDEGLRDGHRLFLVVPPRAMASCASYKAMILE